ncbi:hypothetical protein K432DRAFT_381294 [Lepidopterella palustris CBS 459.81]|uniref:Mediator of RNA polymerase II transcription subunit 11 n=1 Tax=Lepidopterella palustris CBS 459.81 TaxID=1314670 RepID=A0A8E2JGI3_9PEZI|nr:hypothetical protein K432DRAFT_381294 [Lepidopterella palustris CBS 459.81]
MATTIKPKEPDSSTPKIFREHIQELSTIKEQIPLILRAAGTAISALTNAPLPSSSVPPLQQHKQIFQSNTDTFFTLVTQISSSLHAQALALETAGIIPANANKTAARELTAADIARVTGSSGVDLAAVETSGFGTRDSEATVRNGGFGDLDVGWLNARAGDVGRGMEAEVLARVRKLLEEMGGDGNGGEGGDESMADA